MKIALIYCTKHGTTQKIADYIVQNLSTNDVILHNLANHPNVDLSLYDTVIVGGSIHAGSLDRLMRSFLRKNTVALLKKPLALFMCGMNKPELTRCAFRK